VLIVIVHVVKDVLPDVQVVFKIVKMDADRIVLMDAIIDALLIAATPVVAEDVAIIVPQRAGLIVQADA
jgi:hypothetical protein